MCGYSLRWEAASSIVLLVEQVDNSIFGDRGEMITLDGDPMTMEDVLEKIFPTLLGII